MKLLTLAGLLVSLNIFAQNTQTVKIHLSDRQSHLPIEGANVSIPKYALAASTDAGGNVRFDGVPLGRLEVEISSVEYGKYIYRELLLENARQLVLDLELQASGKELEEVKVTSSAPSTSALMNVESITAEQIFRFPATFFDPARLAMSFAGVANTNDQANNVSVRGNSPEFVQWRMEGVEIVNPNHLSNAGMFSDKPAAVGGGTNILSAQMLGNMNFLSGAFPAGYSNALAGVFDMNLRTGNSEEYQHVIQAGLIGVDLSSEGPINKKKGSSYLVNYRYSFTGLLALAGVNFGGEAIAFQDVAFNLNFPTRKAGTFTFFGMGGISSNIFAPDADSTTWESSKDLNNIDFYGRMGLLGAKHSVKLFKKWNLRTVLVNSALENLRNAYSGDENVDYDYSAKNYLSLSTAVSGDLNALWAVNAGVQVSHQFNKFNYIDSDQIFYSMSNLLVQPYLRITNSRRGRFNYNVGFVSPYYSFSGSQYLEPRLSADYSLTAGHKVKAAYGLHSQVVSNRVAFYLPYRPARSHHFTLGYQFDPDTRQSFSAELFYQNMFNLTRFDSLYVSVLNGYEIGDFTNGYYVLNQKNQGRNYGVELNYKHYLTNGFFALLNATFYKSQFKAFDNKFYDTRYAGNYIYNATAGKEWEMKNGKLWGLNARLNWVGGFRDYQIITEEYQDALYVYYNMESPLYVKYDDYFRVDLRAYIKTPKKRGSQTISLDIQNLTNRANVAYNYFDSYQMKVMQKKQLGLVPMLNYRWEF
ncbi:MAG: TonB-dependent receptor [Leadbetterella sp.]|nr:TonB-dependent receptor [Leadbetterella sp.]